MRKLLIAAGLAGAMAVVPVAAGAATPTSHVIKGKGAGTLTLNGGSFTIDGNIASNRGKLSFHSSGTTTAPGKVSVTTTFTAANGTITTSATGTARRTKVGRIYTLKDTVTGGAGVFAGATGGGRTAAKAKLSAPGASTGTVKFVFVGKVKL